MGQQFVVPVSDFRGIVSQAQAYCNTRGLRKEMENVYFRGANILSFNGKAGFRAVVGFKVPDPGFGLIVGQLAGLLASLPSDGELSLDIGDSTVRVTSGAFKANMRKLNIESLALPSEPGKKADRQAWPDGIWQAVRKLYFSVSQDETKAALRGVFIQSKSATTRPAAYASDSYRISRISLAQGFSKPFTIPDTLVAPIIGQDSPPDCYAFTEALMWVYFDGFSVHSVQIEETFPDVEPWFGKTRALLKDKSKLVCVQFEDAQVVQQAIDRLLLFTPDVLSRVVLTLDPKKKGLTLSLKSEQGEASEVVPVKHSAQSPVTVHINGKFFSQAVGNALTCYLPVQPDGTPLYFLNQQEAFEHLMLPFSQS